ncbi:MAG: 8-amino-7-oxononanoate synthase [Rhodocyclaceae bacterium]|nr:8-amino-7-oxononanoate synthase [Rhodocyclaceae bacterium]
MNPDLLRHRRITGSPCGTTLLIDGRKVLSFASNDYLGLAADSRLIEALAEGARQWGAGSGASHFLGGHFQPHQKLEERLAAFVGAERALLFSTGYLANLGVIPALVGRHETIFADRLNHASLIDAVRLSGAKSRRYPHLDLSALSTLVTAHPPTLIVTDAVFSMEGDIAPLPELLALANQHNAYLLVDDAHGFGVLGKQGRGTLAHFNLTTHDRWPLVNNETTRQAVMGCSTLTPHGKCLLMGTLGKAAGISGAFVAGDASVIEGLIQNARTAIYTTAAPPHLAHALLTSLDILEESDDRRAHLRHLIQQLRAGLAPICKRTGWKLLPSETPIQPLVIGGNQETLTVANTLLEQGIWAPAIRPPTVPNGQARLRISLSAAHREEEVARLVNALTTYADKAPDQSPMPDR